MPDAQNSPDRAENDADRCRVCGAVWTPVRRGECVKCGSDAGPCPPWTRAIPSADQGGQNDA